MFKLLIVCLLAAVPGSLAGCGGWLTGTMTGYDNLGSDDLHAGCIAEYCGTSSKFLNEVPVVAIHQRDWSKHKYHYINVKYNNKTYKLQSWDLCADKDCGNCCTKNADYYTKPGYLLDVEKRTLSRLFGLNYSNTFYKVSYQICDSFDPAPTAKKYGLKK